MDNTNAWAKAGVVLRNDATGTGASPGYAAVVATPGNGVAFQWDANGNGYLDSFGGASGVTAPVWVRPRPDRWPGQRLLLQERHHLDEGRPDRRPCPAAPSGRTPGSSPPRTRRA